LLGALIGFIVWLYVIKVLYRVGWVRAFITAVIVAILIFIVGLILPVVHVG